MGLTKKGIMMITTVIIVISIIIIGGLITSNAPKSTSDFDPNATVLASGSLRSTVDCSRTCHGTVNLVQATDGKYYLYFIDIFIDVKQAHLNNEYVYFSERDDLRKSTDDPGNIVEIGLLSDYRGNFSYVIPETINPLDYKTVIIYNKNSNRFFFRAELKGETGIIIVDSRV